MTTVLNPRPVEHCVTGRDTSDGAGVRLTRVIGQSLQRRLDPFLMLDAFRNDNPEDYLGGFPDHPHRGFEAITYMIEGRMRHRDSGGHEGLLASGGVQWMTAAYGLIHSEMPEQEHGRMEGFQLWLNLPARDKLAAPWYQDFAPDDIPEYRTAEGVRVRVIGGTSRGQAGAVQREATQVRYLDIHLPAGSTFTEMLPAGHNAAVYVYRGQVDIAGTPVDDRQLAILAGGEPHDGVIITSDAPARVLLLAGQPLNEPIAQYGPFVMNHPAEIEQAIEDYRNGRMG